MSVCLDSWAVLAWLDGEEPDLSGTARMVEAARLKARTTIALADGFAAAHELVLLTGDPELLELIDPPCRLEDLREF